MENNWNQKLLIRSGQYMYGSNYIENSSSSSSRPNYLAKKTIPNSHGNISNAMRTANLLKMQSNKGSTQFSNDGVNYLGRVQGQLGGGGAPLRNQF